MGFLRPGIELGKSRLETLCLIVIGMVSAPQREPWPSLLRTAWSGENRLDISSFVQSIGEKEHLRIEFQTFYRLPRSNALLLFILCYLIALQGLVTVPKWGILAAAGDPRSSR